MLLEYNLTKNPEEVLNYLGDVNKFIQVHPLIKKCKKSDKENWYMMYEKSPFAIFPITFQYPATFKRVCSDKVIIQAVVFKLVKLKLTFDIINHSRLREHIEIRSIVPIRFLFEKILVKQHRILIQKIEEKIAS